MKALHSAAVRFLPVFAWGCLAAVFLFFMTHNVVDIDVWHAMTLGREIVNSGHVPFEDPFSYTPTVSPSIHHEWGAGLLAYAVSQWAGAYGLLAVKYALGLSLALCLVWHIRRTGVRLSVLAVAAPIGLALLQPSLSTVRAQFYSLVVVAVLLIFLESDRRGKRWWIAVWLPLFVLWLNVHGGFVVGFGILAAEWLQRALTGRKHAHLLGVGLGMAALVPANPYGFRYYWHIVKAIRMDRPYIEEWQPMWFWWDKWPVFVALFVVSVLVLVYVVTARRRWDFDGLFPLLLLLAGSILCLRITYFYAIAWICTVPGSLQLTSFGTFWDSFWRRRPEALIVFFAAVTFVFAQGAWLRRPWELVVPGAPEGRLGSRVIYPVGAVDYLRRMGFRGNLMVYFPYGAFVSWKLYPAVKVSMDSRYEAAYPTWLVVENIELYRRASSWRKVLAAYPTDAVLVERVAPLAERLAGDFQWRLVYQDRYFLLFARNADRLTIEDHREAAFSGEFP